MARNLHAAGATLSLYNRSPEPLKELTAEGISTARAPNEAIGDMSIVMVRDSLAVEAVITGGRGLIESVTPGMLVLDMGTTDLTVTKRMAEAVVARGGDYIDAPVSGGQVGAMDGSLTIMAGGSKTAFARAKPVFETLGTHITHIGDIGTGQIAKTVNQVIVAMTIDAVAEGLTLAKRSGVDPARVREALAGGFAASRILELHGERMIEGAFEPGGRSSLQLKDVIQALDLAAAVGLDLPGLQSNRLLWERMVEIGLGDLDQSALIKLIDKP